MLNESQKMVKKKSDVNKITVEEPIIDKLKTKTSFVYQSCDSKECFNKEKELIGVKKIDVISRIHIYFFDTKELKCKTCGKITTLKKSKKVLAL